MRRIGRWLWRGTLGLLAVVVVAIVAALIAVHTDWGREQLRARAEAALAEVFPGGGAHVERIEGSVLGTLVATGVELRDHEGRVVVTVARSRLDVALLPLARRTLRIESLALDGVVASIHRPTTPPPPRPVEPATWSVELPSVVATGVRVDVATSGAPFTLDDVWITGAAVLPTDQPILATAWVHGTWTQRGAPLHAYGALRVGDTLGLPFVHAELGGVAITATGVDVDRPAGHVLARGTRAQLAALVPGLALPGDVIVTLDAATEGDRTRVTLAGRVGAERLDGVLAGSIEARTAHGVLAATGVDLAAVTEARVRGRGSAVVAFAAEQHTRSARGAVIATGAIEGAPRGAVIVGFDATAHRADGFVIAGGDGATYVGAVGALVRDGARVTLVHGIAGASTQDPTAASAGRASVRGSVAVTATARGPLDALDVDGAVTARRLRYDDLGAGAASGTFQVRLTATPSGTAHAAASGVTRRGELLGRARVDARTLAGRRFAVTARAYPAAAPVIIDADAVITPGDVVDIALGRHRVQTEASTWTGRGGAVRIDDRRITVRGLRSTSGRGAVAVEATVGRRAPVLTAKVDVRDVPASVLDPALGGTLKGVVAVERRGVRWTGGGTLVGRGLVFGADAPPVDGEVAVTLDGRRVVLAGEASSADAGGVRVALEVRGPRDLTDLAAWKRVALDDLHAVELGFDALQPRLLTQARVPGVFDGTLEIRDGKPSGVIHVRDVPTRVGGAAADVTLALAERGFVDVHATATAGTLGTAELAGRLQLAEHPFDPEAWRRLGKHVLAGATARSAELELDPRAFGVDLPYRARGRADVVIGPGAESVEARVELCDVRGGALARPLDATLSARSDARGTEATLRVISGTTTLVKTEDLRVPVSLARWIADPRAALAAPLGGKVAVPQQPMADVLALVGRLDVRRGTLAGTATLGGTLRAPTGAAMLAVRDVVVAPKLTRRPPPTLEHLRVAATWTGSSGTLEIEGVESGKGTLAISARGTPFVRASIEATVTIDDFEIAPVAVFLPGALAGASGLVDANLGIRGLDPVTAHVRGTLAVTGARLPLAPAIGTLRDANAQLEIKDNGIVARLDGKIGAGTVVARANTGIDGRSTTFVAHLTDVAPIGVLQPKITAAVTGALRREGLRFTGEVDITNTVVRIPDEGGTALLDPDAPEDLYFVDLPLPELERGAVPPAKPWLVVDVNLARARIEAPRYAGISSLYATAAGRVKVSVGETVGMDGAIQVERGNADLFGHRYRVEEAEVVFDGTPDARFDVELATDLPEVTMLVRLAGRLSELDALEPQLSSQPAIYSQGQLLGFFFGGRPGGDPNEQARDVVVGAGSSIASQRVARWIERGLAPVVPLRLDVASCVPRLSDSAVVCTFGKWATRNVFVWYDYQSERRHGDNTGNARIEWHFRPRWTLETAVDFDYAGADLTWRKRW